VGLRYFRNASLQIDIRESSLWSVSQYHTTLTQLTIDTKEVFAWFTCIKFKIDQNLGTDFQVLYVQEKKNIYSITAIYEFRHRDNNDQKNHQSIYLFLQLLFELPNL
jgi:hypothetical protein